MTNFKDYLEEYFPIAFIETVAPESTEYVEAAELAMKMVEKGNAISAAQGRAVLDIANYLQHPIIILKKTFTEDVYQDTLLRMEKENRALYEWYTKRRNSPERVAELIKLMEKNNCNFPTITSELQMLIEPLIASTYSTKAHYTITKEITGVVKQYCEMYIKEN